MAHAFRLQAADRRASLPAHRTAARNPLPRAHCPTPEGWVCRAGGILHLRSWKFEGSGDGQSWALLDEQTENETFIEEFQVATFKLPATKRAFKMFRLSVTGQCAHPRPAAPCPGARPWRRSFRRTPTARLHRHEQRGRLWPEPREHRALRPSAASWQRAQGADRGGARHAASEGRTGSDGRLLQGAAARDAPRPSSASSARRRATDRARVVQHPVDRTRIRECREASTRVSVFGVSAFGVR